MFRGWQEQGPSRLGILGPPSLAGPQPGPTCPIPEHGHPPPAECLSRGPGSTLTSSAPHIHPLTRPKTLKAALPSVPHVTFSCT